MEIEFGVKLLSLSDYTVKDSFTFSDETCLQNSAHFMAILDVDSLFTNIPLDETINLCVDLLCPTDNSTINGIPKGHFHKLLEHSTSESFFMFNGSYYKQVDGVAMGSPLGPTLANTFM